MQHKADGYIPVCAEPYGRCAMTLLQVRRTGPLLNRRAIITRPQNKRGSLWAMKHRQG